MSEELFAISRISPAPAAQGDYDSICAALMQSERGRWFLQEYARRNRSADTRLLLAAIERIEAVVCAERGKQVQPDLRSDLLDMAEAITRTRAEVAEIRSDAAARPGSARPDGEASPLRHPRDVFATAERIRDVTWAMRGHGIDPSTCDQLEELAASILSATSLRDPGDHRASKLSEVLQYLEHRIDTLLESCADGDAAAPAAAPARAADAFEAAPTGTAEPENAFVGAFVIAECALDRTGSAAGDVPPLAPTIKFHGPPPDTHDDLEDDAAAPSPPPTVDIAPQEPPVEPPPDQSPASALGPAGPAPAALAEHGNISPAENPPAGNPPAGSERPAAGAELSRPPSEGSANEPEPAISAPPHDEGTADHPPDAFLPAVELPGSSHALREPPGVQAASAARAFLPEIDMPGLDAAWTGDVPPEPALPALDRATQVDGDRYADLAPAEPAGADAPMAHDPPPSPAPMQLSAAVPMPQPPRGDPLAALKALSDDELIAIFS
jgi:hypothetical protein